MNNLKFRVWDKKLQITGTVSNIDFEYEEVTFYIDDEEELETCQPFEDVELMQSTGLFDKNGKEIFEKDIVQYLDGEYSFIGVVEISAFGIFAKDKYDNYNFEDFADENTKKADVVVIGNIYENKELLENDRENDR